MSGLDMSGFAKELESSEKTLSPWVTLVERTIAFPGGEPQVYHSLKQPDYVSVFAITADRKVPLVSQYRPACREITFELPGGLQNPDEDAATSVEKELMEDVGYRLTRPLDLMGTFSPDSGRLENRFWCFFAADVEPMDGWLPELGLRCELMNLDDFLTFVSDGKLIPALHVAVVGLASLQRRI
jgi:ADP-ribose pyrophosphatase